MADAAFVPGGDADLRVLAGRCFFQRDFHGVRQVAATVDLRAAATASTAPSAATPANSSASTPQDAPAATASPLTLATRAGDASLLQALLGWFAGVWAFAQREGLELRRDRIRLTFALLGPIILLVTAAWSVSFDVEKVQFAVLDHDQTHDSRQLI